MTRSFTSFRGTFASLALVAAVALSACATSTNGEAGLSVAERHPITVAPHMKVLRMSYDGPRAGLSSDSAVQLSAFVNTYLDSGNGAISVSAPRGQSDAQNYFASRIAGLGVARARILVGTDETLAPGSVEISYIGYVAEGPECGDWSVNLADTSSNLPSPNFGCASQHNLAAMVADPRDLTEPDTMTPSDAQRRMTVIDKYRKGETTGAQKSEDQSAVISGIGK
jgi:pilus assembly protein CpaD